MTTIIFNLLWIWTHHNNCVITVPNAIDINYMNWFSTCHMLYKICSKWFSKLQTIINNTIVETGYMDTG